MLRTIFRGGRIRQACVLLAALMLLVVIAAWASRGRLPLNRAVTSPVGPPYEYRGLIHCHTDHSDGGRPALEVAAIAAELGLDFLVLTDHNTLAGREHEGMHGSCRVLVGSEVSTDSGHLLAIGVPETVYKLGGPGPEVVREVELLGGLSVVAHPINGNPWREEPEAARPNAIEVLNGDSAWRNAPLWKVLAAIPAYVLDPRRTFLHILDSAEAERALWDRYLEDGPVTGLAGGDCHGRLPVGQFALPFPSYELCLQAFQTHILTGEPLSGDFSADRQLILDAIRRGRAYLSLAILGPVEGFRFTATPEHGSAVSMGGSLESGGPVTFVAEIAAEKPARLRLLRDGEIVKEFQGRRLEHTDEGRGVYRVEVFAGRPGTLGGRTPWVLSNPIRVGTESKPSLVSEIFERPAGKMLADFDDGEVAYVLEGDPVTVRNSSQVEPHSPGAEGTKGAARLRFQVAPTGADAYWAIADRQPHSLPGAQGISFQLRANPRLRLRLFIRDEDPVGPEDKEWFSTTFMAGTEWTSVTIPFEDLRCLSTGGDCRLDTNRINGIFLVADMELLHHGVAGEVLLDEVRVFYDDNPTSSSGN